MARVDFEWHGQAIKAGDVLFLMNISANTDPEIFEDPFTINPNRDCRSSLSFAPGFSSLHRPSSSENGARGVLFSCVECI
ncbi:hypothetical protein ACFSTD_00360 [Novosphingobium colocasiae]